MIDLMYTVKKKKKEIFLKKLISVCVFHQRGAVFQFCCEAVNLAAGLLFTVFAVFCALMNTQ